MRWCLPLVLQTWTAQRWQLEAAGTRPCHWGRMWCSPWREIVSWKRELLSNTKEGFWCWWRGAGLQIRVGSFFHQHWFPAQLHFFWVLHVKEPELPVHLCSRSHPVVISDGSGLDGGFLKPHRHRRSIFNMPPGQQLSWHFKKGDCSAFNIKETLKITNGDDWWIKGRRPWLWILPTLLKHPPKPCVTFLLIHLDLTHTFTPILSLSALQPPYLLHRLLNDHVPHRDEDASQDGYQSAKHGSGYQPAPSVAASHGVVCAFPLLPTVRACLPSCLPLLLLLCAACSRPSCRVRLYHRRSWQSCWGRRKVHTPLAAAQEHLFNKVRLHNGTAGLRFRWEESLWPGDNSCCRLRKRGNSIFICSSLRNISTKGVSIIKYVLNNIFIKDTIIELEVAKHLFVILIILLWVALKFVPWKLFISYGDYLGDKRPHVDYLKLDAADERPCRSHDIPPLCQNFGATHHN